MHSFSMFLNYFLLFLIYSVLGWLAESIYIFIMDKKIVNRGFLLGPYCPIYGFGALITILYLNQYKDNILTVFIMSIVLCSTLEYITSYLIEKIFKIRLWDYSQNKFNINGRVCGRNSLLFGIASIIVIYILNPFITNIINHININIVYILSTIWLIIFIADTIASCNILKRLKISANNIEVLNSTKEITNIVKNKLSQNNKIFQRRLLKAFPKIDLSKYVKIKNTRLGELKKIIATKK